MSVRTFKAIAVAAALMSAAACGAGTTATGASSSPSPSPAATPATQAQLAAILLTRADLPSTWTTSPHTPDPSPDAGAKQFSACLGIKDTTPDKVATADSVDFAKGATQISSDASSYKSEDDVAVDRAAFSSAKVNDCLQAMVRSQLAPTLPPGSSIAAIDLSVTPGAGSGPKNVAGTATGSITVHVSGKTIKAYVSVVFITGRLLEAEVSAFGLGQPTDAAALATAVKAVADRAAAY